MLTTELEGVGDAEKEMKGKLREAVQRFSATLNAPQTTIGFKSNDTLDRFWRIFEHPKPR